MKILILACNTGEGHNSTATAIIQAFERRGVPCDRGDSLAFLSRRVSSVVRTAHEQIYRHIPGAFKVGYRAAEEHPSAFQRQSLTYRLLASGAKRLKQFIEEGGYDIVVCTHAFSALMVTGMLEKYPDMTAKFLFVATDYTCSPSVEQCRMEAFFIPDASLIDEFVSKDVEAARIQPVGLPVREPFLHVLDKAQARERCGIPADAKHLLVMCGSMGCGPLEKMTEILSERLPPDTMATVICGTNKKLYRTLCRRFGDHGRVRILGYVQNVPELMDASELYLTKPGGISVTEATVKGLPMVLVNAVAGCEEHNLRYCLERGMAVTAEAPHELAELCLTLLSDGERLEEMKRALAAHAHPDAAERIVQYVIGEDGHDGMA